MSATWLGVIPFKELCNFMKTNLKSKKKKKLISEIMKRDLIFLGVILIVLGFSTVIAMNSLLVNLTITNNIIVQYSFSSETIPVIPFYYTKNTLANPNVGNTTLDLTVKHIVGQENYIYHIPQGSITLRPYVSVGHGDNVTLTILETNSSVSYVYP